MSSPMLKRVKRIYFISKTRKILECVAVVVVPIIIIIIENMIMSY